MGKDSRPDIIVSGEKLAHNAGAAGTFQLVVGITLAVGGGPLLGLAIGNGNILYYSAGGGCVVAGVIITIASLTSGHRRRKALMRPEEPAVEEAPKQERDSTMPMLGALLVYKYQFITEGQLQKALELQRKQREEKQPLGEVLRGMGFISSEQLHAALEYQRTHARRGPGAR